MLWLQSISLGHVYSNAGDHLWDLPPCLLGTGGCMADGLQVDVLMVTLSHATQTTVKPVFIKSNEIGDTIGTQLAVLYREVSPVQR